MDPFKTYKEKVGTSVARRLEEAIINGALDENQSSEAATFILDNIDNAKDSVELVAFLEELSNKWPVFKQVLVLEEGEVNEKKDEAAAEQATELLKNNNIDEALKVAENANNAYMEES